MNRSRSRTHFQAAVLQPLERRVLLDGSTFEAPRFLFGDTEPVNAAGPETQAQVAAGNGNYLAVWIGNRSALGTDRSSWINTNYPGEGSGKDVFGALLDADGKQVGNSFPIYAGERDESAPRVAWNGSEWLVTFKSYPADNQWYQQIGAVRVSPTGQVLDANPVVITEATSQGQAYLNSGIIAQPGGNWLVVYNGQAKRVSPSMVVLDATPVNVAANMYDVREVFWHDGAFAISQQPGDGTTVVRRYSSSLGYLGGATISRLVTLASNGNDMYAAWTAFAGGGTNRATFGSRVSDSGQLLDNVQLTEPQQFDARALPAWDGANWAVATDNRVSINITRVSAAGAVLNPGGTTIAEVANVMLDVDLAASGDTAVAVFEDRNEPGANVQLIGSAALVGEQVTPRSIISRSSRNQMNADLASGPGGFLAAYKDMHAGLQRIVVQRLDTAGNSITAEPLVLGTGSSDLSSPQVAFNGSVYTVVWQQSGSVYTRRLDPAGQPVDPAPVLLADNALYPDIAVLGDQFLVVSYGAVPELPSSPSYWRGQWHRLNSDGQIVARGTLDYFENWFNRSIKTVAFGERWLVIGEGTVGFNNPNTSKFWGAFVDAQGNQSPGFSMGWYHYAPSVASSGNTALVVYDDKSDGSYHDVYGRIIHADGTMSEPFVIADAPQSNQIEAKVAWNGSEYVVVWIDHRNKIYPSKPEGDIYAARVSETGVVLDPGGVPVANSNAPEDAPTVNFGHGITLMGYSTFNSDLTAGSMRVAVREIFAPLTLEASEYQFQTDPHVRLDFTADVSASLTAGVIQLVNLTTGATIPSSSLTIAHDTWHDAALVRYADGAALPDGHYRLTIPTGTIISTTNQPLVEDVTVEFFVLAGDANRDGRVDLADFNILAANFGQSGRTFSQGDFDYDGVVSLSDFNILAGRFGVILQPAARQLPAADWHAAEGEDGSLEALMA